MVGFVVDGMGPPGWNDLADKLGIEGNSVAFEEARRKAGLGGV
jgi:hypothetical protein